MLASTPASSALSIIAPPSLLPLPRHVLRHCRHYSPRSLFAPRNSPSLPPSRGGWLLPGLALLVIGFWGGLLVSSHMDCHTSSTLQPPRLAKGPKSSPHRPAFVQETADGKETEAPPANTARQPLGSVGVAPVCPLPLTESGDLGASAALPSPLLLCLFSLSNCVASGAMLSTCRNAKLRNETPVVHCGAPRPSSVPNSDCSAIQA